MIGGETVIRKKPVTECLFCGVDVVMDEDNCLCFWFKHPADNYLSGINIGCLNCRNVWYVFLSEEMVWGFVKTGIEILVEEFALVELIEAWCESHNIDLVKFRKVKDFTPEERNLRRQFHNELNKIRYADEFLQNE